MYRLNGIYLSFTAEQRMLVFYVYQDQRLMLITFKSSASAPVQMFGHIAFQLLELMGRQPKAPGAFYAEDVPAALAQLQLELSLQPAEPIPASADLQGDNPATIPLRNRALPLIQLMQAAVKEKKGVSWE